MWNAMRVVGLAAVVAISSHALAQTWTVYNPVGTRVSVEMPGKWKVESTDFNAPFGLVTRHVAIVDRDDAGYRLSHIVYPKEYLQGKPIPPALDDTRDQLLISTKGTLRSEEQLTIGTVPARHLIIDVPKDVVLVQRILFLDHHYVNAVVAGPQGVEKAPDTRRFFDSLKVKER